MCAKQQMNFMKTRAELLKQHEAELSHYKSILKQQVVKLNDAEFYELVVLSLHQDHYPMLEAYLEVKDKLENLDKKKGCAELRKKFTYLVKSHKASLISLVLGKQTYSPLVLEWLTLEAFRLVQEASKKI